MHMELRQKVYMLAVFSYVNAYIRWIIAQLWHVQQHLC